MLTYFHRCLFALTSFTLALVALGVTARPLPILEQTDVDGTAPSPSSQSMALPQVLSPGTANVPASETLASPPSSRVEDTAAPAAESVQEPPKAINIAEVTDPDTPAEPVVDSIATPATAGNNPSKVTENSPPQDGSSTTIVEEKGEATTKTPPVGSNPQASESATAILTKSPPSAETSSAVPVEEIKEPESPIPENKEDPIAAASTPDSEKSESPAPERTTTDALPDSQQDLAADSPHVEEVVPHSDPLLESTSAPVVENVASALPTTDAATTEETPKKDDMPETNQETSAPVVEEVASAPPTADAATTEETPKDDMPETNQETSAPVMEEVASILPTADAATPEESPKKDVMTETNQETSAPVVEKVASALPTTDAVTTEESPKKDDMPVVEEVASSLPTTDAATTEETPKKDVMTETNQETSAPVVIGRADATFSTDTATIEESPKKDVMPENNQETVVDPKPKNDKGHATEASVPATETVPAAGTEGGPAALPITQAVNTDDQGASQTPPPTVKEPTDHKKVQTIEGDDPFSDILDEKETESSPATVDNIPADLLQNKILPLINKKRALHGSKPLIWNATLAYMASLRLEGQCVMPDDQERDRVSFHYAVLQLVPLKMLLLNITCCE